MSVPVAGAPDAARTAAVPERAPARRLLATGDARLRIPLATYRVQFNAGFGFGDAALLAPYLQALGVSDLYASPYLMARPDSAHGYDVTDHSRLNPTAGSERAYRRMVAALRRCGLGQVLDIVPNHMGIGSTNPWWMDVLENGPAARRAEAFDISWRPLRREYSGKVLLPLLGDHYGKVLERGELLLSFEGGAFFISYWDHRLPVDPRSYAGLLRFGLEGVLAELGAEHPAVLELQSIITAATNLPARDETAPERLEERNREKDIIKRRLGTLYADTPAVQRAIAGTLTAYAGRPGETRSFDLMDALIEAQAYRLSFWRVAAEEINYRRFFEINELAAIRAEQPAVFADSHRLVLDLLASGALTGLRIDHIDGLWDPAEYTLRLQAAYLLARFGASVPLEQREETQAQLVERLAERLRQGAGDTPPPARPLWVVAEKILEPGEQLPDTWAVSGTTGYDMAVLVNGLFIDSGSRRAFDDIYGRFTGKRESFRDIAYHAKRLIMDTSMASELNVLGEQLARLAGRNRRTRDFTVNNLTDALREVVAAFPVYRTYIGSDGIVNSHDRGRIDTAVARASRRNPAMDASVFDYVRDTLLLIAAEDETEEDRRARLEFVMKFQQYTGPVMAKGVEDTAFYRYHRLVSLNEVGGDPDQFGVSAPAFHRANAERQARWPYAMTASSTHDTKRGEDARARINVLSELPREWRSAVTRWRRLNRRHKPETDGGRAPDANEEYLLYQTLIGAWPAEGLSAEELPAFIERVQAYLLKAVKEAKVNTSWINPISPYDAAVQTFVAAILQGGEANPFVRDFLPFQRRIARAGMVNSLAQTLLRLTAPGVPDIYQGSELWNLSLVDPDNRRPVDFAARAEALAALAVPAEAERAARAAGLLAAWPDGWVKLYLTHRALTLRQERPALFLEGAYRPLEAEGIRRDHLCAFARVLGNDAAIAVAPRICARLAREPDGLPVGEAVWGETILLLPAGVPGTRFRDRLTGAEIEPVSAGGRVALAAGQVLATFPVALLETVD